MLNRTIYSGLSYLAAPLAVARLYYLSGKHQGYRKNIRQRFGYFDSAPELSTNSESLTSDSTQKILWLHAVSVGEVIASEPLVNSLLAEYSQLKIFLTTMTPTGAEQVARSFSSAVKSSRVVHRYAPYDLPGSVDRFLTNLNPCGLVIMETELWPNWIAHATAKALPCILMNGRLSEKSARGYEKLGFLAEEMFSAFDCISAQTERDASRFRRLGAKNVVVTGNLKADFELSRHERTKAFELADILGLEDRAKALIAASTHAGEDEIILDAFSALLKDHPDIRLILVPRHPDRTLGIAGMAETRAIGYRVRSKNTKLDDEHPVVICDLLGELRSLYGLAGIAIMGGTLVNHGGHNPLEPAAWSLPLIAGPSQRNFDLAFDALEESGAMLRTEANAQSLSKVAARLLDDKSTVDSMGEAALDYLSRNRGATQANLQLFRDLVRL